MSITRPLSANCEAVPTFTRTSSLLCHLLLRAAAGLRRTLIWQVCVAPDYVLAHRSLAEPLAHAIVATWREWFGEDEAGWQAANGIPRMGTAERWHAAAALLGEAHGGNVLCGGLEYADLEARYLPPTVVLEPRRGCGLLTEEGPSALTAHCLHLLIWHTAHHLPLTITYQ